MGQGRQGRTEIADAIDWLLTSQAVRERCEQMFLAAKRGELEHFRYDPDRLPVAAAYVVDTIRTNYPTLNIPYHSRWRHFSAGGRDRWAELARDLAGVEREERARIRFDLAVTSVLLDAGAGAVWRYCEPDSGVCFERSEGLAIASLRWFVGGGFSADAAAPLRADARALSAIDGKQFAAAFQVNDRNPIVGLEGRVELLRKLGATLATDAELFGTTAPRVGNLFDYLRANACDGHVSAQTILRAVLRGFGSIWPGRIMLGGTNLGDVWRHPAIRTGDLTDGLVPFHKLSQWLTYSLIEPLQEAGIAVTDVHALTGLPEYRNGGLLIDLRLLEPKHEDILRQRHSVESEIVVEWRALTVALLDRLADEVRALLGLDAAALPLAKVLEGGTWAAGRRIAVERRPDGNPPLEVDSDGTVF